MSKEKRRLIALLSGTQTDLRGVDWKKFLKISDYSKTGPLLFFLIQDAAEKCKMPRDVYEKLRDQYAINRIRNALVMEEFERLRAGLQNEGVRIILLKGMFLLRTVYSDMVGARRMEDVDILVREQDVDTADRIVRAAGYQRMQGESSGRRAAMYFKYNSDGSALMPVHLHWHVANLSPGVFMQSCNLIDMNEIWTSAKSICGEGGGNLFAMCPEHSLLALCEHGFRHAFSRLMLLYDIHLFITRQARSLGWDLLEKSAREWGMANPLSLALTLSRRMFGTVIPKDFLRAVRPQGLSISEKLVLKYVHESAYPQEEMCFVLYMAMKPNPAGKIRFIRTLFPRRNT